MTCGTPLASPGALGAGSLGFSVGWYVGSSAFRTSVRSPHVTVGNLRPQEFQSGTWAPLCKRTGDMQATLVPTLHLLLHSAWLSFPGGRPLPFPHPRSHHVPQSLPSFSSLPAEVNRGIMLSLILPPPNAPMPPLLWSLLPFPARGYSHHLHPL